MHSNLNNLVAKGSSDTTTQCVSPDDCEVKTRQ